MSRLGLALALLFAGQCAGQYISYGGSGHNNNFPNIGVANGTYVRVGVSAVADYGPALDQKDGVPLPSPRSIDLALSGTSLNKRRSSTRTSEMLTYLGQYISHDLSRRADDLEAPVPLAIPVPDPYYSDYATVANSTTPVASANSERTRPFLRSKVRVDVNGVRQTINTLSGFLDGNVIYGNSEEVVQKLRTGKGGLLKDDGSGNLPLNQAAGGGVLLAMSNAARRVPSTRLRACGNPAINQNPGLLALGTLFLRVHNSRARNVSQEHPEWDDEAVFQRARSWTMAHLQAVSYNEYFPKLGIILPAYKGFNASVNPGIDNFFATVAYRYGHAVVTDTLLRLDENWAEHPEGHILLMDGYYNADASLAAGVDALLRGLMSKEQGEVEARWSAAVQHNLFGQAHANGTDIAATNIQRGRDHGIPDYNSCRRALGLAPKATFAEVTSDAEVAATLGTVYGGNISNCDAYICGLAEDHYRNAHVGELFYASMVEQLTRLRDGDFWYYLNPNNGLFNPDERQEISRTGLGALIAANFNVTNMPTDIYTVPKEGGVSQCAALLTESGASSQQNSAVHQLAGGAIQVEITDNAKNGGDWLRITVTAAGEGFVGFGVPQPGAPDTSLMPGADVIIGRQVNGIARADDYQVPNQYAIPVPDASNGGASNVELISFERSPGRTVMVIERPFAASDAMDQAIARSGAVRFIASFGSTDDLNYHGVGQRDSLILPDGPFSATGSNVGATSSAKAINDRRNHGILMAINFFVVLPLGALLARQLRARWIPSVAVQATLFYIHILTQTTGVALATAGFVIAINQFNVPVGEVILSHGKLGIATLAILYSQFLMGFARPPANSRASPTWRRVWETGHSLFGRSAIIIGTVNAFLGIYIFSTLYGGDLALWGGLCAGAVGAVALLQHVLDRRERHAVDAILLKHGMRLNAQPQDDMKEDYPVVVLPSHNQQQYNQQQYSQQQQYTQQQYTQQQYTQQQYDQQ